MAELQRALLAAAMSNDDPSEWSAIILEAMAKSRDRLKLIPLLATTGGDEALKMVAAEFENGDAMTRDVCFDVLTHWKDISSARVLREITASGNKTFGMPAFDAYMRMVSASGLTPERKLLMIKDMAPYAAPPDARAGMIASPDHWAYARQSFSLPLTSPTLLMRSGRRQRMQLNHSECRKMRFSCPCSMAKISMDGRGWSEIRSPGPR
ncbi:MAG: hypothetical protein R2758_10245 [Bacteroidales bacterium]